MFGFWVWYLYAFTLWFCIWITSGFVALRVVGVYLVVFLLIWGCVLFDFLILEMLFLGFESVWVVWYCSSCVLVVLVCCFGFGFWVLGLICFGVWWFCRFDTVVIWLFVRFTFFWWFLLVVVY